MLILPSGHYREVHAPRTPRRFDRPLLGFVVVVLVAGAIALVISLASSSKVSHNGCIAVSAAGPVGGSEVERCGTEARLLCAASEQGALTGQAFAQALVVECRKAGLPTH
jgi:hypothetical protein